MALQLNHIYYMATPLNHHNQLLNQTLNTSYSRTTRSSSPFQVCAVSSTNGKELIQSGTVKPILAKDAALAMNSDGYKMLDIRPEWEREKARVKGSLHVPLFVADMDNSPLTLLKKWVHFGYIGLWTGQSFTMFNDDFLQQVEAQVPDKDDKLLLACGEGLRSVMAAAKLHGGGYTNLAWLAGGFNQSKDADFLDVEGTEKLQYATIGGVSYIFLKLLILLKAVE
ncbi:hypothetical protein ACFE04_030710 [Oxalis oulophora]